MKMPNNPPDCAWCGSEIVKRPYPNKRGEVFCSPSHRKASNNNLKSFQNGMGLTPEEFEALREYKRVAGQKWKFALNRDWKNANSHRVDEKTYALLHNLRDRLGPVWLEKFRLPK